MYCYLASCALVGASLVLVITCAWGCALNATASQEGRLVRSVMLAHCVTAGIPIGYKDGYGLVPDIDDWAPELYNWQTGYVDKLRQDLIRIELWDTGRASICIQ